MIERRRRFFKGDSLLDMPISRRFLQFLSICMRIPKRNWHYPLLTSGHGQRSQGHKNLRRHVESVFTRSRTEVQISVSLAIAASAIRSGLPAGVRRTDYK